VNMRENLLPLKRGSCIGVEREIVQVNLVEDFDDLIDVMMNEKLNEFQYVVKDGEWTVVKSKDIAFRFLPIRAAGNLVNTRYLPAPQYNSLRIAAVDHRLASADWPHNTAPEGWIPNGGLLLFI